MERARLGCSGWDYDAWRENFYPEGLARRRRLEHYATRLSTVEVNASFYRLLSPATVQRWVDATPPEFRFAIKASRYLTHVRRLRDLDRGIRRFYAPLTALIDCGRLGPVLWQLPESFHRDDGALAEWAAALPPGLHTVEFRHDSWFVDAVYMILSEHGIALTVADHPARPFPNDVATASWRYLRFHYGRHGGEGNYSAQELQAWAQQIRDWLEDGVVWAYFNNDWQGFAPANALALARTLGERVWGPCR